MGTPCLGVLLFCDTRQQGLMTGMKARGPSSSLDLPRFFAGLRQAPRMPRAIALSGSIDKIPISKRRAANQCGSDAISFCKIMTTSISRTRPSSAQYLRKMGGFYRLVHPLHQSGHASIRAILEDTCSQSSPRTAARRCLASVGSWSASARSRQARNSSCVSAVEIRPA